ncbi:MAG: hypothetical protein A2909_02135 [Candidatus Tagabacteria bacterium RIFCSPLOWO2_01_FULL_39_11]|uniref:Peptidase A24A N-terminal domain-containing protein n=1 Tax=Candidatus Tagabacteria bacterium RIFCSPLOWO2_01_FULL_39_11 TaxID=1802295 RepID=A0A1G2LMS4_9BACT|nr:MAG: hypothetical protein A2909_02135 [Candidatus Tagabacteria bacterium RIFCSPLOWO2_01_FULL_39_11]
MFAIFILGAIMGSFLNVVIFRFNTGESIVKTGSRCFSCGKKLKWFELIPILSFLIQKGRCGGCKSKISWQYPIVELITGVIFLLVFLKITGYRLPVTGYYPFNNLPTIIYFWIIFSLLMVISVYDFHHKIIPNKIVYLLIFFSLFSSLFDVLGFGLGIWGLFGAWDFGFEIPKFALSFLTGLFLFAFFALLWLVSRGRWIGFGDAKLAFATGLFLGWPRGLFAVISSFWIGGAIGILLLIFSKKTTMKSQIPFGPFLALSAFLVFLLF